MLFNNNIVAQRKSQASAFTRWFSGEEGVEDTFQQIVRNSDAVVAYGYPNYVLISFCENRYNRIIVVVRGFLAFDGGVETVGK